MGIRSIAILVTLLCHLTVTQGQRSALCFLTRLPTFDEYQWAQTLANDAIKYGVDVFMMIDDNGFNVTLVNQSLSSLRLLQFDKQRCLDVGYHNTISLGAHTTDVTAWDKALMYFNVLNTNHSFVWLIEDDVFIPSVHAFRSLHQLYWNASDLIVARNEKNLLGNTGKWLWRMAVNKMPLPWSCSMVNLIGLSRHMLIAVDEYVRWRGIVPFHEFFFNSLAMQKNLTVISPPELSTIVYRSFYSYDHIQKRPNNFWHPAKDTALSQIWRQK
jgi:hypothetical protein